MKKFIVIYHAVIDSMKQMENTNPKEQEKGMEAWMQWAQKCGDKLVDIGAPLINGLQLHPDGTTKTSDKNVVGYSILQAESLAEAKSLLQGHPHLNSNPTCSIEVHETMPLPGN